MVKVKKIIKSSATGKFVSKKFANEHKDETIEQTTVAAGTATREVIRDTKSGQFTSKKSAASNKNTTVKQKVKKAAPKKKA